MGHDSTYGSLMIHRLGLVLPFLNFTGFDYLWGHGLAVGGNINRAGFETGTESFWGLVQYQNGFFFFLVMQLFMIDFVRRLVFVTRAPAYLTSILLGLFLSPFLASAVQENSYNISHTSIRLLILILLYWGITGTCTKANTKKSN